MIYEHFQITGTSEIVLEFSDIIIGILKVDDVQRFHTEWNEFLFSMLQIPKDDML